ncbi:MAG: glycosyltransferase family 39 protein [Proteobacteria bacterium]|nr:glycosyltransferase family 39 protein [Pseudomonadota bacterium]
MRLNRRLVPLLLVLLAGGVMAYRLAAKPLWNDEAFSYFVARHGLAAAVRFISQDTQPPLYYLLLSLWLPIGHGVAALRLLSVLAMALAVLPLYAAARRLFDDRTAAVAGLLFALTPLVVGWAQKVRPYPLQTLFLAIAFCGFVEVWCAPEAHADRIGQGMARAVRTRRWGAARADLGWLACALGGAGAMLTQQPAGFFLLGCNCAVLFAVLPRPWLHWRWLVNWTVSQLVLIGVWLLWLPEFLHQIAINMTPEQIALRHTNFLINGTDVVGNLVGVFGIASLWRGEPVALVLQLGAAALGAALLLLGRRPGAPVHATKAMPLLVPLLVPVVVCVLGFLLVSPVLGYVIADFIFLWLPYSVLIAYAVVHMRPRLLGVGLLGVLLLADAWGLRNYFQTPNQPTAQVAAVVRAGMRPGDGVILSDNAAMRWTLGYYLGARRRELVGLDVTAEWDLDRLLRTPASAFGQQRDWVVLPGHQPSAVSLDVLAQRMRLLSRTKIGEATVLLFESDRSPGTK